MRTWPGALKLTTSLLALLFPTAAGALVLPADGFTLRQVHVQFEWPAVSGSVSYDLEVVVDDGSVDPFALASPVASVVVSGGALRTPVTSGLAFGENYAWRVGGDDGAPLGIANDDGRCPGAG